MWQIEEGCLLTPKSLPDPFFPSACWVGSTTAKVMSAGQGGNPMLHLQAHQYSPDSKLSWRKKQNKSLLKTAAHKGSCNLIVSSFLLFTCSSSAFRVSFWKPHTIQMSTSFPTTATIHSARVPINHSILEQQHCQSPFLLQPGGIETAASLSPHSSSKPKCGSCQ